MTIVDLPIDHTARESVTRWHQTQLRRQSVLARRLVAWQVRKHDPVLTAHCVAHVRALAARFLQNYRPRDL